MFAYVLLAIGCTMAASAQPKVGIIGDMVHDFGRVYQGRDTSYTVIVKNVGTSDLIISRVNTGCNCTDANITKLTLPPSDTALIHITFHTARFVGPYEKAFDIMSNDPASPHKYLSYKVNVISVLEAHPMFLYLGNIVLHEENHASVYLKNIEEKTVRIKSVRATLDSIKVSVASTEVAPGDSTLLTASFIPTRNILYKGEIVIETDSEIQSKMKIYYGFVKDPKHH